MSTRKTEDNHDFSDVSTRKTEDNHDFSDDRREYFATSFMQHVCLAGRHEVMRMLT